MLESVPHLAPLNPADLPRWEETSRRWRMLYGCWRDDLMERLRLQIGNVRREAWGEPDLSSNVFRASVTALAVLYDRPPRVPDPAFAEVLRRAGLWSLMQRVQRDSLGMREVFVRVDVGGAGLTYSIVPPHRTCCEPMPDDLGRPGMVAQAVLRVVGGAQAWTWDVFDVRDPVRPSYRVLSSDGKTDLSAEVLTIGGEQAPAGGLVGEAYPYRYATGQPFLPFVLYHAANTGYLFDPFELRELVDGSLNCAVLWTFFGHCVRDASWPQRWTLNARIPGLEIETDTTTADGSGQTSRAAIVTDPSTVLELETNEESGTPGQAGQWGPGSDPAELQEAVGLYERRVAGYAGISPADIQRVAGDPRSGYALAISRDGQRSAQGRFEPSFRLGDEELLSISAALLNRSTGTTYAETGAGLVYDAIPASPEEQQAEREHLLELLAQGLIDRVAVYRRLNPGTTEADAAAALLKIAEINARYRAA